MVRLTLSYDMRAPSFGPPAEALYRAALEQCTWADERGWAQVGLPEHHSAVDGYLPSPVVMATGIGACTKHVRISINLLLLPFYHPIRLAEDLAVADLISGGRLEVMVGAGYREEEFDLYDIDLHGRGKAMEEGIVTLQRAWTGEPFEFRGRTVQVLPRPAQRPRPRVIVGGASPASARRAARIGDGYAPIHPKLYEIYVEEMARLGKPIPEGSGPVRVVGPTNVVAVSEDPERTWAAIMPNLLHDAEVYASWTGGRKGSMFKHVSTPEEVRASGQYAVLTPEEAVAAAQGADTFGLRPLVGGIDPDLAWASLELFAAKVLPHLDTTR
jgi:alkanesulfonate monooxygenase SsuD/methylene tetrahydromethanopterin reductase-like flavin-dependent oxidoreductase (luciferase family)